MSTNTTSSQKLSVFSAGGLLENTTAEYVFTSLKAYPNEILGSTETGAVAHRQQLRDTNWQPLAEVKLSLDQATQCLKVHSDFFAHNNGFVMGDNVTFNADGTFVLHGRADRIAKIEGKRISLSEMETLLKQHPWVSDAYILTMQNHREYLAAVIALHQTALNRLKNDKKSFFNAQFNGILSNTFERSLLPKQFRYVEHIPVNSQGKYVPSELRELFK
jgi:acyl-coenzyme A synthetase/AMP-(fatty) acid ligase